ncbi:MAG: hypothetical protein Q4C72_02025 [Eubacteriales bacterium]|nr:hypothetical protein [Eubacteriales bacterium]
MEKCVYCGRELPEKPLKAKAHTRSFNVCSEECRARTEEYVQKDKRFKTAMYLLIFVGGLGFLGSAFFGGNGPLYMLAAYIGQLVAGLAFLLLPYPVISFESFHAVSIRGVTRLSRIIGALLSVSAVVLMVLTLRGA